MGIETTFVDPSDPENFARAVRPNTRAMYGETIGNPLVIGRDGAAITHCPKVLARIETPRNRISMPP